MHCAKLGDRVRVQYSRHQPATDRPNGPKVVEFTVGSRDVLRGLSLGVVDMAPGDRRRLTLQPQEAYGQVQSRLIREIPRQRFPTRLVLKVGQRLTRLNPAGRRRQVRIVEIKPDTVVVDGNHVLAGKVVELEVTVVSVDSSSDANKRKQQFDLGGEA